jgi:hypothetical protein
MFCSIGSVRFGTCRPRSRRSFVALIACLLAVVAGNGRAMAQAEGPVAAYAFTASAAADFSGNVSDASLLNGPIAAPGRFGNGLRLDGVDDAVQLPVTDSLTLTSAFTFEAWIAPSALGRDRSIWCAPMAR